MHCACVGRWIPRRWFGSHAAHSLPFRAEEGGGAPVVEGWAPSYRLAARHPVMRDDLRGTRGEPIALAGLAGGGARRALNMAFLSSCFGAFRAVYSSDLRRRPVSRRRSALEAGSERPSSVLHTRADLGSISRRSRDDLGSISSPELRILHPLQPRMSERLLHFHAHLRVRREEQSDEAFRGARHLAEHLRHPSVRVAGGREVRARGAAKSAGYRDGVR